ncbi:hypothetical protein OX284_014175 [Flavobacterium sp. SUN046]|uniref:hypothetical protein n=1 Tax=Flavobacterium sp. SUN046 TaxID=3002440 RepID=UPI002DBDE264|nr:hypothetical protein [Flavobacterium sp. SUN046]MEC4050582.1 hypothetical protein [Flavobacterium sp. SUN046]
MSKQTKPTLLHESTIIEVVRTKQGEKTIVKQMTYGQFLTMEKQKGYNYQAFQVGYSSFIE